MTKQIYKRAIFDQITKFLFTEDIVVLHGARQVGKTHLMYFIDQYLKNKKNKTYYLDLEDSRYVKILDAGVDEFIKYLKEEGLAEFLESGKKLYVLIDEIQYLKNPSSFLKLTADHYKNIKLIVSGSSSFAIKNKFKNSLVGRTINFEIFPLSFSEFLEFRGGGIDQNILNLNNLTEKKLIELKSWYKEYVLYGGYPKIVLTEDIDIKEKYLQQIIDTYIKKDIKDLANIKDTDKFNKLVEILSAQSGQLLDMTELANTCGLAKQTVENYLFILENTYIIKLVKPYHKNIRSELFKMPKIFFYDSGLMQMLWLKQLQKEIIGQTLETAVFSDLVKKYGKNNILYWRTTDKKEIDFILNDKNKLLPIEVKLNSNRFDKTAINYFCSKYGVKKYAVVALSGNKNFYYPWMV